MDTSTWVPSACWLPSAEQPLRVAEFDTLFADALRHVERVGPTHLRLHLSVDAAQRARDLTDRESECCSFFTFTHTSAPEGSTVDVEVPAAHVAVLDGLEGRARSQIDTATSPT